jgi:hypothetical protein
VRRPSGRLTWSSVSSSLKRPTSSGYVELDDVDVKVVEAELGTGAVADREIEISRGYRQDGRTWNVRLDEEAIVKHLRASLDLPAEAGASAKAATTVAGLLAALQALDEPTAAATALIATITGWRDASPSLRAIDLLTPRVPVFVYFDEYSTVPGKVSIPNLIRRRDDEVLDRGERSLLSLLELVGAELEDFSDDARDEHLIRELENSANTTSDEVFEYWSQNRDLSVNLTLLGRPEPGAEPPLDQGPILDIRVYDDRHRATVPFDERSVASCGSSPSGPTSRGSRRPETAT